MPIVTQTELEIKRQAEFIDKLKAGEIWKNVIIVVRSTYITYPPQMRSQTICEVVLIFNPLRDLCKNESLSLSVHAFTTKASATLVHCCYYISL